MKTKLLCSISVSSVYTTLHDGCCVLYVHHRRVCVVCTVCVRIPNDTHPLSTSAALFTGPYEPRVTYMSHMYGYAHIHANFSTQDIHMYVVDVDKQRTARIECKGCVGIITIKRVVSGLEVRS